MIIDRFLARHRASKFFLPVVAGMIGALFVSQQGAWAADAIPSPIHSALQVAAAGVTALSGTVMTVDGAPLSNVTIVDGAIKTHTDRDGRFLLQSVTPGKSVMVIDGRQAGKDKADYGYYEVAVTATAFKSIPLPFVSYLPKIDHTNDVTVASPTLSAVKVTTPKIPGLELRIPKGAVITGPDGKPVTKISITPMTRERMPFPMPANINFDTYFTIQPGGAVVTSVDGEYLGVQVAYPNVRHELPGARANLYRYIPDQRGWISYGVGTVSADGKQVIPSKSAQMYEFTSGSDGVIGGVAPAIPPILNGACCRDPVDLYSGLFIDKRTDLTINDVMPISVTRTYRQADPNSRSFGVGTSLSYDIFLWQEQDVLPFTSFYLILPDGSRVNYVAVPGTSDNVYGTFIQSGAGGASAFFGSTASASSDGNGFTVTMKDGTSLVFGFDAPLQAIIDRYGNKITLTRSGGQTGPITQITSPNGRFINLTRDPYGRVIQAQDDIGRTVTYSYFNPGTLASVTDADGGVTSYSWDPNYNLLSIADQRQNPLI